MTQDNKKPRLTRDQMRAKWAYATYTKLSDDSKKAFGIAVKDLGPNIIRSGLVAAIAFLQRGDTKVAKALFEALAHPDALGGLIPKETEKDLPNKIQDLDAEVYMLVTRETLKLTQWLKRAVQAHSGSIESSS